MPTRRIGLIANDSKPGAAELARQLVSEFADLGITIILDTQTAQLLGEKSDLKPCDLTDTCDLLVVLGGDGTILQVLHCAERKLPPLFGINIGTLGFLTTVAAADVKNAIKAIATRSYELSERTLLQVEVIRDGKTLTSQVALNDAVISRGEISRLIWLKVSIGGSVLTDYHADGLIVATPTGSTAYSLSAGGPLLVPDSGVFVVNPICPHVLTNRAVIVNDDSLIEIRTLNENQKKDTFLTLDGQVVQRIESGDIVQITKSSEHLQLAMLPGISFFEVLRQKLRWSGSAVS